MANFAKIGLNNIVIDVVHIDTILTMTPEGVETEQVGINYLKNLTGHETWVQCSFNTHGGQHSEGKTPLRKNYPCNGFTYDSEKDAFVPPKQERFPSWVLNTETCLWEPPVPKPSPVDERMKYGWNEETLSWTQRLRTKYQ